MEVLQRYAAARPLVCANQTLSCEVTCLCYALHGRFFLVWAGMNHTTSRWLRWCVAVQRKSEAADYHKLLMQRLKEQRERRSESLAKKRAVRMASQASKEASQT